MNYCTFIGRVCNDLEIKQTTTGKNYLKFTLAVRNGKDNTDFIPCTVFEKGAELINQYSGKGCMLSVSGKLHITSMEKDGKKATFTDVLVNEFEFLTPKGNTSEAKSTAPSGYNKPKIDVPAEEEYDVPFEL